jgi:hypothetical protein
MLLLKARERHAVDKNVPENMVEEEKRLEELSASILSWLVKGEMGEKQDMLRLGVCACEQPDLAIYYKASAYECFERRRRRRTISRIPIFSRMTLLTSPHIQNGQSKSR